MEDPATVTPLRLPPGTGTWCWEGLPLSLLLEAGPRATTRMEAGKGGRRAGALLCVSSSGKGAAGPPLTCKARGERVWLQHSGRHGD